MCENTCKNTIRLQGKVINTVCTLVSGNNTLNNIFT